MLRELLRGLALVFMADSVIISNIFRSTRSDKPRLPAKNVNSSTSTTAGLMSQYQNPSPTSPTPSQQMFKS